MILRSLMTSLNIQIVDIPDDRRLLRRDRKNRNHFYFEGTSKWSPTVGNFYYNCEHEISLSGIGDA